MAGMTPLMVAVASWDEADSTASDGMDLLRFLVSVGADREARLSSSGEDSSRAVGCG